VQKNPPSPETAKPVINEGEKEDVHPDLLAKALEDLKKLVKGNGIKPETVTMTGFDGEVLNFEAREIFKIETTIAEKRVTGRESGEVAGSNVDARQKISAAIERISRDRSIKKHTITILKKRRDMGLAVPGIVIRLDKHNQRFVLHEACNPCNATGKILCLNCQGKKKLICPRCHGQQTIQCHLCHGMQFIATDQGRTQCTQCRGQGQIACDLCRKLGMVPCPKCKGIGKAPCTQCAMTGWHSHLFLVSVLAKAAFTYDRESLPEEILPLIDAYGPDLVLKNHAQARIIEDVRYDTELDNTSKPDEYIIPYHVKIPWGDIQFAVGGKTLDAKLFGENPLFLEFPPLLEKTLSAPLDALARAAQGNGHIEQNTAKAIRARLIGEAFLTALSHPPPKALAIMEEKYPYGITEEMLKTIISRANTTIRNLTKKPRLKGLAIGLFASTAIFSAYFFSSFRNNTGAMLPDTMPTFVPDAILMLSGDLLIAFCIHMSALRTLRSVFSPLLKNNNKTKISPAMTIAFLWGLPAACILFLVFFLLAG